MPSHHNQRAVLVNTLKYVSGPLQLEFVTSAVNIRDLPESPIEVAVVGRSNVGKSSLINALANRKQLARVSNTPGRTQLINLFETPDGGTVVDLPGYGYAAAPGNVRKRWQSMITDYLLDRESLVMVFALVDGVIGPTELDQQVLGELEENGIPFTVVATKLDKVKPSQLDTRKRDLARGCGLAQDDIVWVSASTGIGIVKLRASVGNYLNVKNANKKPRK